MIKVWQAEDKKTLKRINQLLKDIDRNQYNGIGKPEPLKGDFSGWWSRRIDNCNRLIYRIKDNSIEVLACKGHYNLKKCTYTFTEDCYAA